MDVETYVRLLKGELLGKAHSDTTFYVKQKKKEKSYSKNEKHSVINLTKNDITPPTNLNTSSTIKKASLVGKNYIKWLEEGEFNVVVDVKEVRAFLGGKNVKEVDEEEDKRAVLEAH